MPSIGILLAKPNLLAHAPAHKVGQIVKHDYS
jgi:hypothetical protein